MALLELWRSAPSVVLSMPIQQIVSNAGDGAGLIDDSLAMHEFREYLTKVDTNRLDAYVAQLLAHERVDWTGFALQDLINEVGRRLGYAVENGRYKGVRNQIGFDGIWKAPDGTAIVVEVKTSSTYELKIDRIANYRERLKESGEISENTSMLLAVGNLDTSAWESQIRGSRFAWDVRIVGVSALTHLARLGDDDPLLLEKVRAMLVPREYTRLDSLVDLVLATSTLSESADPDEALDSGREESNLSDAEGDRSIFSERRRALVEFVEIREKVSLTEKRGIVFWDTARSTSLLCSISKRHDSVRHGHDYWYSITPSQVAALGKAERGFVALGCTDAAMAFLFPLSFLGEVKDRLGCSERDGSLRHWNLPLESNEPGRWQLVLKNRVLLDVSDFLVAV